MNDEIPFSSKVRKFLHIIVTVLQQDMRGRFNTGSYFGYALAVAWPLSHLLILTLGYLLRTEIAPMGDSPTVFIATGATPYILCFYPARLMSLSIIENRQLLNIPLIRPIHLMVSRCILEVLNSIIVLFIFAFGAYIFDIEILPVNADVAFAATMASIFLGVGFGFLNATMVAVVGPFYMVAFVMLFIGLYLSAGVYIPVSAFPEGFQEIAHYNPLEIIVEWMRSAYYTSVDLEAESKFLVLFVAATCLALGLSGERFLRGKFY